MIFGILAGLAFIYLVLIPLQAILEAKFADEQTKKIWRIRYPDDRSLPPIRRAVRRWIMK